MRQYRGLGVVYKRQNKNNAITAGKTVLLKKSFQISPRVMVSLLFYWELWDSF